MLNREVKTWKQKLVLLNKAVVKNEILWNWLTNQKPNVSSYHYLLSQISIILKEQKIKSWRVTRKLII